MSFEVNAGPLQRSQSTLQEQIGSRNGYSSFKGVRYDTTSAPADAQKFMKNAEDAQAAFKAREKALEEKKARNSPPAQRTSPSGSSPTAMELPTYVPPMPTVSKLPSRGFSPSLTSAFGRPQRISPIPEIDGSLAAEKAEKDKVLQSTGCHSSDRIAAMGTVDKNRARNLLNLLDQVIANKANEKSPSIQHWKYGKDSDRRLFTLVFTTAEDKKAFIAQIDLTGLELTEQNAVTLLLQPNILESEETVYHKLENVFGPSFKRKQIGSKQGFQSKIHEADIKLNIPSFSVFDREVSLSELSGYKREELELLRDAVDHACYKTKALDIKMIFSMLEAEKSEALERDRD